ncbi:MAG: FAD-dependent oxidoreductase, partial [Firmicutes bacterium]|nr:FAD-dependent oxidoreductase [Bacillota bacterium]
MPSAQCVAAIWCSGAASGDGYSTDAPDIRSANSCRGTLRPASCAPSVRLSLLPGGYAQGSSTSAPTPSAVTNGLKNRRIAARAGRRRARLPNEITVIGAGLAGSEAAWQAARLGVRVRLVEMRPKVSTPAHSTSCFAELVCSNSLGADREGTASGLLKEELRALGSVIMR